ncbi:MAG TPA: glycine betaine ABC transporter substrate-binding protein [Burkholderiales bacterium]|jgi:glycine betaine/proline transport system substrate-binding protein|nr:glycine betaine ABC transporter substrate-binding protein [Burkholderiales bacterium]
MRPGRNLLVAAVLLLAVASARAQDKVVLGQIGISFYAVTGQVVQAVLERLGHTVELRTGSHAQIFPELGKGGVDLLVAAWLPSAHAVYWEQHGKEAVELATLYRGARLFWAVPAYVPEEEVASVEDLKKPQVAERMVKTIRGTGPDSGLMIGSRRIMQAYELEAAGYELLPGKHEEWHAYFEDNYKHKRWFVMPYFRPNYLNRMADMRMLNEPFELLGGENNGVLVAHRNFIDRVRARTVATLRRISLDLEAVAEMDYGVRIEGKSPREAAREWMARNASRVEAWFADR